jgi:hypothetical protein
MDHTDAINQGAAERYALGEMDSFERDEYEEHFFDCPECADEVKAAAIFLDNARAVVSEEKKGFPGDPLDRPVRNTRSRSMKALFWPMPYGAAAAAGLLLSVAGYQGFVVAPALRHELQGAQALQSAPWYFLSVSRGETPVVTVSGVERKVGLTLSRSSDRLYPFYRCEVRDASGRAVLSSVIAAPAGRDELQVLVPADRLVPGNYVLVVTGLESTSSPTTASNVSRYEFRFERK